ncbi:MAG: nucleoside recognition protein [Dissulfuribacterales bacterium]
MAHLKSKAKYKMLALSLGISAAILIFGIVMIDDLNSQKVFSRLLCPLARLMLFIGVGLVAGQFIEASGWTKFLAALAGPFFRFGNLGNRCSAAFTTAFISGVTANAMLLDFYKDEKISRRQLFLTNFVNQLPAYFLHLPTTIFIVIPLTGRAGALYFLITFLATLLRTSLFLVYGHFHPFFKNRDDSNKVKEASIPDKNKNKGLWENIRKKFPGRITNIATYIIPIYILVFILNSMGLFALARKWLAGYVVTTFMPMEALSVVILGFAAEFTSGFAAAGALLNAGVITTRQTVLALLIGNIVAFPIRALRHQLPRYIGIFSPKTGTQLLLMGQSFRVVSIVIVGIIYYFL